MLTYATRRAARGGPRSMMICSTQVPRSARVRNRCENIGLAIMARPPEDSRRTTPETQCHRHPQPWAEPLGARTFELVAFDFDGTLADTRTAVSKTVNLTLRNHGLSAARDEAIHKLIGLPLDQVFRDVAPDASGSLDLEALVADYRAAYSDVAETETRIYNGITAALSSLQELGVCMAIVTSKGRAAVVDVLIRDGLEQFLELIVTNADVEFKKPHPEMMHRLLEHFGTPPQGAILVGDTTYDIDMGRAADVTTCGVTWGYHGVSELEQAGAHHVIAHPQELVTLIAPGA